MVIKSYNTRTILTVSSVAVSFLLYGCKYSYDSLRRKLNQPSQVTSHYNCKIKEEKYMSFLTCPYCGQLNAQCECVDSRKLMQKQLLVFREQLKKRFEIIKSSISPWVGMQLSEDPWLLVRLSMDERRHIAVLAIKALAQHHHNWSDSLCQQISAACDNKTLVGLARCEGDNSRLLPKFSNENATEDCASQIHIIDRLHDLLLGLPRKCKDDKSIEYFTNKALKLNKKWAVQQHTYGDKDEVSGIEMVWVFGSETLTPMSNSNVTSVEKLMMLYLQVIYAHSMYSGDHRAILIDNGVLELLLDIVTVMQISQKEMVSLILKIITNMASYNNTHQHIITSGWLSRLHRWMCSGDSVQLYLLHPYYMATNVHADIVFVHGLMGSPFHTWRQHEGVESPSVLESLVSKDDVGRYLTSCSSAGTGSSSSSGNDKGRGVGVSRRGGRGGRGHTLCWPSQWLAHDLPPSVRVLSMGYEAQFTDWLRPPGPPTARERQASRSLDHRASHLLHMLRRANVGAGGRPVIFITHSMGGLIVKQALLEAASDPSSSNEQLVQNTVGIVFFATPHRGSPVASKFTKSRYKLLYPSLEVQELSDKIQLEALNDKFIELAQHRHIRCLSFGELVKSEIGKKHIGVGFKTHLVPPESSDPGCGDTYYVTSSHHYVCKPWSRELSPQYQLLLAFCRQLLPLRSLTHSVMRATTAELDPFAATDTQYSQLPAAASCTQQDVFS